MFIIKYKIFYFNIVRFFGMMFIDEEKYVIGEFCCKGFFVDVLQDNKIIMICDFKLVLVFDVC